jgi:hypothetical protein
MGRGRAKAKQTKVARSLKYNSAPSMDLSRLQRDLHSDGPVSTRTTVDTDEPDDYGSDRYADYLDDSDEDSAAS